MQRLIKVLMLLVTLSLLSVTPAFCWWWDKPLLTIDGTQYTNDDFKQWWNFWKEEKQELPKTMDSYIDWLLLAREGQQMDLTSDPLFQRKTRVFLQVRSLLLLQQEEVNAKVKISEAELKEKYRELYTPLWRLERLQFTNEAAAKAAHQGLAAGTLTYDELIKRPVAEGGPLSIREDWRRPSGIDAEWANRFRQLAVGQTTEPVPFDEYFVVYRLKEREEGSDEDYAQLRDRLHDKAAKEQEEALTKDLLARLKVKFDVKVDQERLAALNLFAPDETYTDAAIVTTNRQNITEKGFITLLRRDRTPRAVHEMDKAQEDALKERVLNGIISQNLTNWESLDRHYEERDPFKGEYQFHVNHRLTGAVEERLLKSEATVTQAEIESFHQANIARYSQPELVRVVIIEDAGGVADQIWGDVLAGKTFAASVLEHTKSKPNPQDYPYGHLDPAVQKVVDGLAKGEVSKPFASRDSRFILQLVDRTPAKPIPLEKVADSIRAKLERDKLAQKRNAYLDQLKSRSRIEVNEAAWKTIQKELGEAK